MYEMFPAVLRFPILVVCLLTSVAQSAELPVAKPDDVGLSTERLARVDTAMEGLIRDKKLAGAIVMIARHGKVAYLKSTGYQDLESKKAIQDDTIVRIYSMTKAIATAGALMLCDEGKIGLNDPVSKYLPEFKNCRVQGKEQTMPFSFMTEVAIKGLIYDAIEK